MKIKSLFISDLHLNTSFCQSDKLLSLLKEYEYENLFLLGDIIDFYPKKFYLPIEQINVIRKILTKAKRGVKVFYILGNHDSVIESFLGYTINIENIQILSEYVYYSNNRKILLLHGHVADLPVVSNLYHLGDLGYTILLYLNSVFNLIRKLIGLPYFSLSQKIKHSVKNSVKFIGDYGNCIIEQAKRKDCDMVISGHIHKPELKIVNDATYANCGDFQESC